MNRLHKAEFFLKNQYSPIQFVTSFLFVCLFVCLDIPSAGFLLPQSVYRKVWRFHCMCYSGQYVTYVIWTAAQDDLCQLIDFILNVLLAE